MPPENRHAEVRDRGDSMTNLPRLGVRARVACSLTVLLVGAPMDTMKTLRLTDDELAVARDWLESALRSVVPYPHNEESGADLVLAAEMFATRPRLEARNRRVIAAGISQAALGDVDQDLRDARGLGGALKAIIAAQGA